MCIEKLPNKFKYTKGKKKSLPVKENESRTKDIYI